MFNWGFIKKNVKILIAIISCMTFFNLHSVNTQQNKPVLFEKNPEKIEIENKLVIVFHQDISSKNTILRIFINGGKRAVPVTKKGLSYITTRLNIDIPESSKVKKLMTLGSTASVNVACDYSVITINCLSENLNRTLKIFLDNIKNPLFSGLRITNIKRNMTHYQKNENDDPEQLMSREFFNIFFDKTSYGGSKFGDNDSIKAIKKKDITGFYEKFFNLSNMVISVSSDLEKPKIIEIIAQHFSSFPPGSQREAFTPTKKSFKLESKEHFIKKEVKQTLISLGTLLPEISPQNYTFSMMLKTLLSEGIGSKLWSLREISGLAYYFAAHITYNKNAGILAVFLKTQHSKKDKATEELKNILAKLYQDGITEEEFSNTKVQCKFNFLRVNETKEIRTLNLGFYEIIGLGYGFFEKFFQYLDNISLEQFNSYLKSVLNPEHLVQVIIGPEDK